MSDNELIRPHDPFSGHAVPGADEETAEPESPPETTDTPPAEPETKTPEPKAPAKRRAPRRRRPTRAEADAAAKAAK